MLAELLGILLPNQSIAAIIPTMRFVTLFQQGFFLNGINSEKEGSLLAQSTEQ